MAIIIYFFIKKVVLSVKNEIQEILHNLYVEMSGRQAKKKRIEKKEKTPSIYLLKSSHDLSLKVLISHLKAINNEPDCHPLASLSLYLQFVNIQLNY